MKKFLLAIIPITCLLSELVAQQGYITNQYLYELFLLNPAAAGRKTDCFDLRAIHQQQWFGVEDAPSTQLISLQGRVKGALGSGTYIYRDKNGYNGEYGLQQTFSYEVYISKKRGQNVSLTFGLSFLGNRHSIDISEFNVGIVDRPPVEGYNDVGWGYNASSGVMLKINGLNVGVSVTNMLEQNNPIYMDASEPELPLSLHYHAGILVEHPSKNLFFEPSFMYRETKGFNNRFDMNLKIMTPSLVVKNAWMWAALSYRRTMDAEFGRDLGLATTIGVIKNKFSLGVEYQYGLTGVQRKFGNNYQAVIGYSFCKKPYGGVPCSSYDSPTRKRYKKYFEDQGY